MPKYRKLHVKTVESLDINDMPDDFTRLLWVLLPLALCREGRGLDNPAWVKSRLFPLRLDVSTGMIDDALTWFVERDMIRRYCVDGRAYFYVPTFHKYQGTTRKEAESDYPPPPDDIGGQSRVSQEPVQSKSGVDKTNVAADPSASASAFESAYESASESGTESRAFALFLDIRAGAMNSLDAQGLGALVDDAEQHRKNLVRGSPGCDLTGDDWVAEAIIEANASKTKRGPVSINYISAILNRWIDEGYKAPWKGQKHGQRKDSARTDAPTEADAAAIRQQLERQRGTNLEATGAARSPPGQAGELP